MKKYTVRTKEMLEEMISVLKNGDNVYIFIDSCSGWKDHTWSDEDELKFILEKIDQDGRYLPDYETEHTNPDGYMYPEGVIKILQTWIDDWECWDKNKNTGALVSVDRYIMRRELGFF